MNDEQPTSSDLTPWARSFGAVAHAYDRGRPTYPADAATWLIGQESQIVLELGAGTGKLTGQLVDLGHAVHATDPDPEMLKILEANVPDASAKQASAEDVPANDASVDVAVVAQAFHWFDHERALPEIARVLKPGGHLAVVWNDLDQRIPWVRKLRAILADPKSVTDSAVVIEESALFGPVETKTFTMWQDVTRDSLIDIVRSRSYISTLDDDAREDRLAQVRALYDDYGRGHDGMQLAYNVHCYRAPLIDQHDTATSTQERDEASQERFISDGTDTDMLLIDFR